MERRGPRVEDVTFRRNVLRHSGGGFNILAADNNFPSQQTKRILIQDNLLDDISSVNWGGTGRLFQFLSLDSRDTGILQLTVEHNTGFSNAWIAYTGDKPFAVHRSFAFRNNIAPKRTHGFAGGTKSWPPPVPARRGGRQPDAQHVLYRSRLRRERPDRKHARRLLPASRKLLSGDRCRGRLRGRLARQLPPRPCQSVQERRN